MSSASTVTVTPTSATLGAVVTGVELASLDDATWAVVEAAFHEYAVLLFPGQFLDDAQQAAFAARFGQFERGMGGLGDAKAVIWPISNVQADGTLAPPDGPLMGVLVGNQECHTDSSYHPVASKVSMLSAHVVPPSGGQTEWADMRAAWDALSPQDQELLDGRDAAHSYLYSQAKVGKGNELWTDDDKASMAGVRHPLVAVHPATGRQSLYLGRHCHDISGLGWEESEALVERLMADACQSPRVFTHQWAPGDIAVWDNRCVLHRGRPWPPDEPRVMKHSRIAGDGHHEWVLQLDG